VDEIADMDREVEDILQDSDGGETDDEEDQKPSCFFSEKRDDKSESTLESNIFIHYICTLNNRAKYNFFLNLTHVQHVKQTALGLLPENESSK
jgi:hypothetical protein